MFHLVTRGHCDQASVSVVDLKAEIDKLATEYMSSARSLSSEEKLALLRQIQEAYGKCKEFGDDKVQLAMQTYEMVWPCSWLLTTSHLILGVLDPSFSYWDLFWIWEIHRFCLSLFFTGTSITSLLYSRAGGQTHSATGHRPGPF